MNMNKIYVIECYLKHNENYIECMGTSQEGYNTLEKAQAFCESRTGAIKYGPMKYESLDYIYLIKEITII